MRRAAVFGTAVCGVALAACGGAGATTKTFSHPGFAIHFSYPGALRPVTSLHVAVSAGAAHPQDVAIGIAPHDAILIRLYSGIPLLITRGNVANLRPVADALFTQAFGHPIASHVTTIGGLPALAYPPIPAPDAGGATSRVTLVFYDHQEYELNCQYTAQGRATIVKACAQMLSTLHT